MTAPSTPRIAWRETGAGTPVVALHGSAGNGALWRGLAEHLAGRYRVITPDLPGYGRSPAAAGGPGLAADAEPLIELIASLGAPAHVVGHSYGGAVALEIARLRPDLVRSLTLVEPAAFHVLKDRNPRDRGLGEWIAGLASRIAANARAGRRTAAIAAFIDFWNGPGAWARSSEDLRAALAGTLDAVLANFAAIAWEPDRLGDYARITAPALAVFGLESRPVAMRTTELLAETLPNAVLRLLPGAGHMAPLTDPHLLDPMIAAHLAAVDGRAPALPRAA